MNITRIREVVADLAATWEKNHDAEAAHVMEKAIWEGVLESIAAGEATQPKRCAEIALKTRDMDFPRWFA